MAYSKIAVGVDFSKESEIAVQRAMDTARRCGADVVLVHAGELPAHVEGIDPAMKSTVERYESALAERLDATRKDLEALRESLVGQGPEVSNFLVEGFADQAICDAAEELRADLIVMGTKGRTGMAWLMMGSASQRVVRMADRDVLIGKEGGSSSGGFAKILVPMDFSPTARASFHRALDVAASGAEIQLLHCVEAIPRGRALSRESTALKELSQEISAAMRERGSRLIEGVEREDLTVRFHVEEASAKEAIVSWCTKMDADLVAMGSRGFRGVRRWLLGSVAEATIARAPCSVLVCHTEERA